MTFHQPKPQNENGPAAASTARGQTKGNPKVKEKVRQNAPFVNLEDQVHVGELVKAKSGDCSVVATIGADPWPFTQFVSDAQPRIKDLDLGERLGLERPIAIRRIILRHIQVGNIRPMSNVSMVERFTSSGKSRGFVKDTSYWLTESEALFIVSQSETKNAVRLTMQMIAVFIAVRRGLFEPNAGRLAYLETENKRLEATAQQRAVIGNDYVESYIKPRIERAAQLYCGVGGRSVASHRRGVTNRVRAAVGWSKRGARWTNYPNSPERVSELLVALDREIAEARDAGLDLRRGQTPPMTENEKQMLLKFARLMKEGQL